MFKPTFCIAILCLAALTACQIVTPNEQIQVYSVSVSMRDIDTPPSGSIVGGTTLYIRGAGFATSGNIVKIGNNIPCDLQGRNASSDLIVCDTTAPIDLVTTDPGNLTNLNVTVSAPGKYPGSCSRSNCLFSYIRENTPTIVGVYPRSVVAGQQLNIAGVPRVGDREDITTVTVGNTICARNSGRFGAIPASSQSQFSCVIASGLEAGYITFDQRTLAGSADKHPRTRTWSSSQSRNYELLLHPTVDSITQPSGSTSGNTIVITGSGFSRTPSKNNVFIGGVTCNVLSSSETQIVCSTGQEPDFQQKIAATLLPTNATSQINGTVSSAGMRFTRYNIASLMTRTVDGLRAAITANTAVVVETGIATELRAGNDIGGNYARVYRGYFKVPVSGMYVFRALADDQISVFMSSVRGSTDSQFINYSAPILSSISVNQSQSNATYFLMGDLSLQSRVINMNANEHIYMEVWHLSGVNSGSMIVSAEVVASTTSAVNQGYDVFDLRVQPAQITPEILQFTQSGTGAGLVNYRLTRLDGNGVATYNVNRTISWNATAAQFNDMLNAFDIFQGYDVRVTLVRQDSSNNDVDISGNAVSRNLYNVSIMRVRPDALRSQSLVITSVAVTGATSSGAEIVGARVAHSTPITGAFTLSAGGRFASYLDPVSRLPVQNIPLNVSGDQVRDAFSRFYGCRWVDVETSPNSTAVDGIRFVVTIYNCSINNVSLVASGVGLAGGVSGTTPQASVVRLKNAADSLWFEPINSEHLYAAVANNTNVGQVVVMVNQAFSVCRAAADCSYTFTNAVPPPTSVSFNISNSSMSITMDNTSNIALTDYVITLAGKPCTIDNAWSNMTSINCVLVPADIPTILTGNYLPVINITNGNGRGLVNTSLLGSIQISPTITSTTPGTVTYRGGQILTVVGTRLPFSLNETGWSITYCGKAVDMTTLSASGTGFTIVTPSCDNGTTLTVTSNTTLQVTLTPALGSAISVSSTVLLSNTTVPNIASVSKNTFYLNSRVADSFTISGTGFGTSSLPADVNIYLTNSKLVRLYTLPITAITDTAITATILGVPLGRYFLEVSFTAGDATSNSTSRNITDITIDVVACRATSVTGLTSAFGGSRITIAGTNFAASAGDTTEVFLQAGGQNLTCPVVSVSPTSIACTTPNISPFISGNVGQIPLLVISNGQIAEMPTPFNLTYNFTALAWPIVNNVNATPHFTNTIYEISGSGFVVSGILPTITFGSTVGRVLDFTSNWLEYQIPASLPAGVYPTFLRVAENSRVWNTTVGLNINGLSRNNGSGTGDVVCLGGSGILNITDPLVTLQLLNGATLVPYFIESYTPSSICLWFAFAPITNNLTLTFRYTYGAQVFAFPYLAISSATPTMSLSTASISFGTATITLTQTNMLTSNATRAYVARVGVSNALITVPTSYALTTVTANTFTINTASLTAGQYNVYLFIGTQGLTAVSTFTVTGGSPTFTSNVPSSWLGGPLLTVTGSGLSDVATLTVDGFVAPRVSLSSTQAVFRAPAYIAPQTQTTYQVAPTETILTPISITTTDFPERQMTLTDGRVTTEYVSGSATCNIVLDMTGPDSQFTLNRVRFFVPTSIADPVVTYTGATLATSTDNIAWTNQIAAVQNTVKNGWNEWRAASPANTRYVRFQHTSVSGCRLGEIEVYGQYMSPATLTDLNTVRSAVVKFFDGQTSTTLPGLVQYSNGNTPSVTNALPKFISPKTTTSVTITGVGFGTVVADVSVSIDGVSCTISTVTNTQITCDAQIRSSLPTTNTFQVTIASQIANISCQPILYADRWSSNDTWGTLPVPAAGARVVVPQGMVLLIDQNTPRLGQLIVQGTVAFDDAVSSITLTASSIVLNNGILMAGFPGTPYLNNIQIQLVDAQSSDVYPVGAARTIVCNACKMRMYGLEKTAWVALDARSTVPGITTSQFVVNSAVTNWVAGDEVVISGTALSQGNTERRTISSIDVTNKIITLTQALTWPTQHIGNDNTTLASGTLTLSAQAAVITRNIKILGTSSDMWTNQMGARIVVTGTTNDGLDIKLSNIEVANCGHSNNPRGYCLHFNMNGDMQNNFIRGVSIHDAVSRLVVLSGVDSLLVDGIVGFMSRGHGLALQNGAEQNNVIRNSFILGTYPSLNGEESDIEPASFWITHPMNTVSGNVAGGSEFDGISYDLKLRADGESASPFVCPRGYPAALIANIVHSNKRAGLRIPRLISSTIPCKPILNLTLLDSWSITPANPLSTLTISGYTSHANGFGIWIGETGAITISGANVADFSQAGIRIDIANNTNNNVLITGSNIVGQTTNSNPGQIAGVSQIYGLMTPWTNNVQLTNLQFVNFAASYLTVMQVCGNCSASVVENLSPKFISTTGITYSNIVGPYVEWKGPSQYFSFLNADNALTLPFNGVSRTVNQVVPYYAHMDNGACATPTSAPAWSSLVCTATPINPARVISIVSAISNNFNNPFEGATMKVFRLTTATDDLSAVTSGFSSVQGVRDFNRGNPRFGWSNEFVDGQTYAVWWNAGIDFTTLTIVPPSVALSDASAPAVILRFNATWFREVYEVRRVILGNVQNPKIYHKTAPLNPTTCSMGDWYHDLVLQYVYLCVSGRGNVANNEFVVTNIQCHKTCANFRTDVVKEPFVRAWSNATQWPGAVVPVDGSIVTVPATWTLVVNVDTAALQNLTIDGDLLAYGRNTVVTAESIWIRNGSFAAGNSTSPYEPTLNFVLNGAASSTNYTVAGVTANKFFVVSGQLELYGLAPTTAWTRLTSQVSVGSTSMTVASVTDWAVGDTIVLAPSFNNALEYESVTITAISGLTVTFTPAAQYVHYGDTAAQPTYMSSNIDMRSGVGHVSRRIKVSRGTRIADNGFWGARLLVIPTANPNYAPWLNLRGVQFDQGGQFLLGNSPNDTAALHFLNTNQSPQSSATIDRCSFTNCNGYCLRLENNSNIAITNNVFYEGRRFIVSVEGQQNYAFTNNFMVGARVMRSYEPLTLNAPMPDDVACYHQFKNITAWNTANNLVTDNLCQGSQLEGFVLPFTPCASVNVATTSFARNTAGTCSIGFLLNGNGSCLAAQGLRAYGCTVGVMANPPNTTRLQYNDLMLADNQRGLTLRNGYLNTTGDSNVAIVSNSWFSALSRPTCTYCYGASATACSNIVGIRMMTSTINGKLLPGSFGLSFDNIDNFTSLNARTYVSNVNFDNFQATYSTVGATTCVSNTAMGTNSNATDQVGSIYLTGTTATPALSSTNIIAFTNATTDIQCGNTNCTGMSNFLVRDNAAAITYIPRTHPFGTVEANCTAVATPLNGFACARNDIGVLEFESISSDFDTRTVWPVRVSYIGSNWTSSVNAHRNWSLINTKRAARFNALVRLQQHTTLVFPDQPPVDMKFQLGRQTDAGSAGVWTIVNVIYPSMSGALSLTIGGNVVNPIASSIGDSIFLRNTTCGANRFFTSNNSFSFVLTGESSCQIRVTLSSQLSMTTRINSDLSSFNANGGTTAFVHNLASALKINASRIVIRDLYEGSTVVVYSITPDPAQAGDSTAISDNLNQINTQIQNGVSLGSLGPIISSSGTVSMVNSDGTAVQPAPVPPVDNSYQTTVIIVSVVCSVVGAAGIAVGIYFLVKKLRSTQVVLKAEEITCQSPINEASEPKKQSIKVEVVQSVDLANASEAVKLAKPEGTS